MKLKLFSFTVGVLFMVLKSYSQNTPNGLENIIVEKYYISTLADSPVGGKLSLHAEVKSRCRRQVVC